MSKSDSSDSLQMPTSPSPPTTIETVTSPAKAKKTARFSVANVTTEGDGDASRKNSDADIPELPENDQTHQKSHQNTHNSATYNTWYFKSLRHYLTRDVLPAESNYRNLLSLGRQHSESRKFSRPTLDELHDENGELKQNLLDSSKRAKVIKASRNFEMLMT